MAFGTILIIQNDGRLRNTKLSTIVAATRAAGLNRLEWQQIGKSGDVPLQTANTRLGYGVVIAEKDISNEDMREGGDMYSFGVEGDISQ
jgi:hypothetical protein